jgi:choline-sulfatase
MIFSIGRSRSAETHPRHRYESQVWRCMAGALTCALALACAAEPPFDIVIVTLDTTRWDMLGSYGGRGETPYLDALAEDSARYEEAITTAPYTGPAHASLMTGLYPAQHGLRDYLVEALPARNLTLAELLAEHGYDTAAFVSTYVLDPRYGLDQGFALYSSPQPEPGSGEQQHAERPGPETFDEAIAWLRERPSDRPFFLWLHSYDAHAKYGRFGAYYEPPNEHRRALPRGVRARSEAAKQQRYYEQAGGLDVEVERILAVLRKTGRYERTLLVITADHGELLGFHGRRLGSHSSMLVDETVRVPLLVRVPGRLAAGVRTRQVSLIDVFPTVLEVVGIDLPTDIEGQSLLASDGLPPRPAYSETLYEFFPGLAEPGQELASLRHEGWKLIVRPGREELFDLRADPDEKDNLAKAQPARLVEMRRAMNALRDRWTDSVEPTLLEIDPKERAEHEDQLRALGYIE